MYLSYKREISPFNRFFINSNIFLLYFIKWPGNFPPKKLFTLQLYFITLTPEFETLKRQIETKN